MYNFQEELDFVDSTIKDVISNKDNVDSNKFLNDIYQLQEYRKTILNYRDEWEDINSAITSDSDKKLYYDYKNIINGHFDENTGLVSRTPFASDFGKMKRYDARNNDKGWTDNKGDLLKLYNNFYNNDETDTPMDFKRITMGKILYKKIEDVAKTKGIDLTKLGIKKNEGDYGFEIPHDKKSFVEFSKLYADAIDDTFLNGLFINTANNLFGENTNENWGSGDALDGRILRNIGKRIKEQEELVKKVENRYGVGKYYTAAISPFSEIDSDYLREIGFKKEEYEEVKKYIHDRILQENLLSKTILGNIDDINAENGGMHELKPITDTSIKEELQNAILRGNGDKEKNNNINQGDVQYQFVVYNGTYGTQITMPKGSGHYSFIVEGLSTSELAEHYVSRDSFKYRTMFDEMNAKARPNRKYSNELGSKYSGYFKAEGDNIFKYCYDINYIDNNGKFTTKTIEKEIPREYAQLLKQGSDYFMDACYRNIDNNPDSLEEVKKLLLLPDENYGVSFINVLSAVSGDHPEIIYNNLIKDYESYYNR